MSRSNYYGWSMDQECGTRELVEKTVKTMTAILQEVPLLGGRVEQCSIENDVVQVSVLIMGEEHLSIIFPPGAFLDNQSQEMKTRVIKTIPQGRFLSLLSGYAGDVYVRNAQEELLIRLFFTILKGIAGEVIHITDQSEKAITSFFTPDSEPDDGLDSAIKEIEAALDRHWFTKTNPVRIDPSLIDQPVFSDW